MPAAATAVVSQQQQQQSVETSPAAAAAAHSMEGCAGASALAHAAVHTDSMLLHGNLNDQSVVSNSTDRPRPLRYKKTCGPRQLGMADKWALKAQLTRDDYRVYCLSSSKKATQEQPVQRAKSHIQLFFSIKETSNSTHVCAAIAERSCTESVYVHL